MPVGSSRPRSAYACCCLITLIVYLAAQPIQAVADALAPISSFDDTDQFFEKNYQQDAFFRLVADTVATVAQEKPGPNQAEERLTSIHKTLSKELADYPLFIRWKRIFHSGGTDYFDFEIYGDPYRLSIAGGRRRMPSQEEMDREEGHATFRLSLPRVAGRFTREDVQQQRYANKILREAVADGKFFAIKNLAGVDLKEFFSGSPAEVAQRFVANIAADSELERQSIARKMLPILSDRKKSHQLYDAFRKTQKQVEGLKAGTQKGIEITRFVILFGGVPTHLIGSRTEAGEPVPILGHVSERFQSMYFDLAQIETYPQEALADILRVELVPGETLSPDQRTRIVRTHEKYQRERLAPKKKELDSLEGLLLAAFKKAKSPLTDGEIKGLVEKTVHGTAVGKNAPIRWHSLEQRPDKAYVMFSVFGRRYFIALDRDGKDATIEFKALGDLYGKLVAVLSKAMGEPLGELQEAGNTWDDIQSKITHLSTQYYDRLQRRGHPDAADLLLYVQTMDEGNGYLDEIRALSLQIQNSGVNVPAVFSERPLEDKKFVVVQTLFGPSQNGTPGELLELTAVRYKGKEITGKFQTFVYTATQASLDTAEKLGIEPSVFKTAPRVLTALQSFHNFLGSLPIMTHGQSKQIGHINQILVDARKDPIVNPIADTEVLAQRLHIFPSQQSEQYGRSEALIRHYLGMEMSPTMRGARLLRLLRMAAGELALQAKHKVDKEGLSWDYKRFLDKLDTSEKVSLRAQFDILSKDNPGKFYKATSWEVTEALLDSGEVQMLVLDFDKTIARSLGWQGSDDWFAEEHRYDKPYYKGGFYPFLNRINAFLTGLKYFQLMDKEIPRIVAKAQAKGIKVMVLTARERDTGQEVLLGETLAEFGIRIPREDIVLTGKPSGGADKPGGLARYFAERGMKPPFAKMLFMDDGLKYLKAMKDNPELWEAMRYLVWYDTKDTDVEFRPARYYMRKVSNKLKEKKPLRNKDAGYLFNAFGIAYARETPDKAVLMGKSVLKALDKFQGDRKNSDFVRNYIRDTVAEDPELKRALLLQAMLDQPLGKPVLFEDFFSQIKAFWGDIGLDENHERYIKEDPSLREQYDLVPHTDLNRLNVDGLTLVPKGTAVSLAAAGKIRLDGTVQELEQFKQAA